MIQARTIIQRLQPWQAWLCGGIVGYLALSAATGTLRSFHWFMLLVIPLAFLGTERPKRFFLDWLPLFAFWLTYDRLRLIQSLLLARVAVEWPYNLERYLFGWLTGGDVPAHWSRAWLAQQAGTLHGAAISGAAQFIYLSHLFVLPAILLYFWIGGNKNEAHRRSFTLYMKSFAALHVMGILLYLLLPVAPPWWVSLNGTAQPTAQLVAETGVTSAMDGVIVQGLIRSAAHWFAAFPSLHGAYPVLMLLLARGGSRLATGTLFVYMLAMFASTVVLNQHYIIDLIAGSAVAVAAWWMATLKRRKGEVPTPPWSAAR
ncbi:MAG TPA: phosphatase PAP2 family protein [Blastocatellia bacterium]|nr:phosphatase PAP2 family protein [Blastocatellia bacterium]